MQLSQDPQIVIKQAQQMIDDKGMDATRPMGQPMAPPINNSLGTSPPPVSKSQTAPTPPMPPAISNISDKEKNAGKDPKNARRDMSDAFTKILDNLLPDTKGQTMRPEGKLTSSQRRLAEEYPTLEPPPPYIDDQSSIPEPPPPDVDEKLTSPQRYKYPQPRRSQPGVPPMGLPPLKGLTQPDPIPAPSMGSRARSGLGDIWKAGAGLARSAYGAVRPPPPQDPFTMNPEKQALMNYDGYVRPLKQDLSATLKSLSQALNSLVMAGESVDKDTLNRVIKLLNESDDKYYRILNELHLTSQQRRTLIEGPLHSTDAPSAVTATASHIPQKPMGVGRSRGIPFSRAKINRHSLAAATQQLPMVIQKFEKLLQMLTAIQRSVGG